MEEATVSTVLPLLAIVISVVISTTSILFEHFKVISSIRQEAAKDRERIKALEVKTEIFWNAVTTHMTKILMEPHTMRKDELLTKLKAAAITLNEAKELRSILDTEILNFQSDGKMFVYVMIMARLDMIIYDRMREGEVTVY